MAWGLVRLRHDLYGHRLRDDRGRNLCGDGQERLACLATSGWLGRHWRGPIVGSGSVMPYFPTGPPAFNGAVGLLDRIPVVADLVRVYTFYMMVDLPQQLVESTQE